MKSYTFQLPDDQISVSGETFTCLGKTKSTESCENDVSTLDALLYTHLRFRARLIDNEIHLMSKMISLDDYIDYENGVGILKNHNNIIIKDFERYMSDIDNIIKKYKDLTGNNIERIKNILIPEK